jgi:hypothetical protein
VTKLFGYYYEIIYKKGKDNVVADALSQKYEDEGSLTGEIDRPSTERVEPVRGCLITQAVWDEPP